MSKVNVNKVESEDSPSLPVHSEFDRVADDIRARAYQLFQRRGFGDGHAIDDWLRAEREICWPAAKLDDKGRKFELQVAMAGFDDDDIEVTATPMELIVRAHRERKKKRQDEQTVWSEFRSNSVLRKVRLPAEIDVARVKAAYKRGMLTIEAPKAKGRRAGKGKAEPSKIAVTED
jgi:HSP20 family molecular chaperone IbpA